MKSLYVVLTLTLACSRSELDIDDGDRDGDAGVPFTHDAAADAGAKDAVPDVLGSNACTTTDADPSFGATESLDSCSEGQNSSSPLDTNCATSSVAWEYVPAHDIDVTRLELDVLGGGVALYDSDGDSPGAKLFEGTFIAGDTPAWRGVDVSPPIHLVACHRYFIQQVTEDGGQACSIALAGVAERQFNPPGFDGEGWGGPYIWLPWAAHVMGTCK